MFNYAGFDTLCAKEKFDHKKNQQAHNLPIYSTSTFVYDSPEAAMQYFAGQRDEVMHIYSRWGNPTVLALEEKLAAIESFDSGTDATALYFSTGMAAISATLMTFAKNGDTILTQGNLYGTTTELIQSTLADQGVKSIFSDLTDLNKVEDFLKQGNIKVIYLESPANPTLSCIDIDAICKLAKQYNCTTLFDNTFNTAFVQQPLTMGVDYVLYSTTKFLNGHGSALGGAVISYHHEEMKKIWQRRKTLGHSSNAFEAWLTYNGLKTLPLRMKKHIRNAEDITKFLKSHPSIKAVNYVGDKDHPDHEIAKKQMHHFGSMLSFELKGGLDAGKKLMRSIELLTLTASLGTTDTLISHPASMTHVSVPKKQREDFGITDGLIRLSVGLEGASDIIADLEKGL